tara:strand:+ start:112 stop:219 length:108 start_codon:yes stop_codon:yes gene_type:complete
MNYAVTAAGERIFLAGRGGSTKKASALFADVIGNK